MKNDMSIDIHNKSEEEVIDILLKANDDRLVFILAVLKGFSSTFLDITGTIDKIPIIDTPHRILNLSDKLFDALIKAHAFVLNEETDKMIRDEKMMKLLREYYHCRREGDKRSRANRQKEKAIDNYKDMWSAAKKLLNGYKNVFEKREWICNLFVADALAYIGSINSAAHEFQKSKDNFDSSLLEMNEITEKYAIYPLDRSIEIASYNLSNDLRNITMIEKFIANNEISKYDNTFNKYMQIAEKEHIEKGFNRFTYVCEARDEIIQYLDKHVNILNINNKEYREISMNLNVFLRDNNAKKINRSVGKYHTVYSCYDFILLRQSGGNNDAAFEEAASKMLKGLLLLTKSYMGDDRVSSLDQYLDSSEHFSELQSNFARNFTILYGLSSYISKNELMRYYMTGLSKLLLKEETINNQESKITLSNSINEAIVNVLRPFGIRIKDTDEFIQEIRDNIKNLTEIRHS